MIYLIIKSYLSILLAIGLFSVSIFGLGLYFIFRRPKRTKVERKSAENTVLPAVSTDFDAIAGDDVLATQLDLARAYIETGKKELAKIMLDAVVAKGNTLQQTEAQRLLSYI